MFSQFIQAAKEQIFHGRRNKLIVVKNFLASMS